MRFAFAVFLLAASLTQYGSRAAAAESELSYTVSFSNADRHLVDIEALIPTDGNDAIEVSMPVWTPGSYLVREYARNIVSISASGLSQGESLEIEKVTKNRWEIQCEQQEWVRVRYQLYCREMSVRTNWVERDFGVLTGAATFLTRDGAEDRAHRVTFALPAHWARSVSGLLHERDQPNTFLAPDFDALVDNPFVLGNPQIDEFQVDGITHRLVTINDGGWWDNQHAAQDVARIVQSQFEFWQELPYEHYTFLNVVGESGGGLEHDNCTLLMTSRWSFRDPGAYRRWLGLVSHELFHAWNVRRMRPLGVRQYDYEQENYFRELWIAEGITSYYDDLLQVRAGLLSEKDYLAGVGRNLQRVMESPGVRVQSLSDSSFDAWIKYYRPDENSGNAHVSYYTKGALVAWLLDAKIRQATEGAKSLDDVMRLMWERHAAEPYTLKEFNDAAASIGGSELREFLQAAVESTEQLDFQPVADVWGLQLGDDAESESEEVVEGTNPSENPKRDNQVERDGSDQVGTDAETDAAKEEFENAADSAPQMAAAATAKAPKTPYLGASIQDRDGRMMIERITRDSPADQAGWNVDDELLAMADFRVNDRFLSDRLKYLPVGEAVEALLARRGQVIQRNIVLQPAKSNAWSLRFAKKPSDSQLAARKAWLGIRLREDAQVEGEEMTDEGSKQ